MSQITYYAPAGVTSINLSDGSRAVVVNSQITVDSKFRNELEAAGCTANAETDNAVRFTKTVTGVIELWAGDEQVTAGAAGADGVTFVSGTTAPNNADGRPDGTVYVRYAV